MSKPKPTRHAPEEVDAYLSAIPEVLLEKALRARLVELEGVKKEDST